MNKIQIYGPGCAKCTSLTEVTKQAIKELQWDILVEKVTDPMLFAVAGVLMTPALVVDGKVLFSGKVPSVKAVKDILSEAGAPSLQEEGCCQKGEIPSASHSQGCCNNKKEQKVAPGACGCGEGGCGSGSKTGGTSSSGWKKAVVWIVALLILLAAVKLVNRGSQNSAETNSSAVPAMQGGVEVVYYQYGARCPTCIRMEAWAKDAIEGNFAEALKDGKLVFRSIPADEEAVKRYAMTTKSLIIREWSQGKERDWLNLERIWDLSGDEAAFKDYVVQEVRKKLDGVK